jgi:ATP-dependent Clp protease protease subunit
MTESDLIDGMIIIDGNIDSLLVSKVRKQLLTLAGKEKKPVKIILSSPGGDILAGFDLYYLIWEAVNKNQIPVTIEVQTEASSIAILVLQAGAKRQCLPTARFCFHNFIVSVQAESDQFISRAREAQEKVCAMHTNYCKLIAKRSGCCSVSQLKSYCSCHKLLSGQEAKELGLIDEVIK